MIKLTFGDAKPLNILCLGAHSDDIEIGCGGTILELSRQYSNCVFNWVVLSAVGIRRAEAEAASKLFTKSAALNPVHLDDFPDGFLPFVGADVKKVFEQLKMTAAPDVIFTTSRKDAHQDHRLIAELTWNTFRNHLILEYEIPKYDGDIGQPNLYVPLTDGHHHQKVDYLMEAFPSQRSKPWFQRETFLGLMKIRGIECNSPTGYAEAFYCRKAIL